MPELASIVLQLDEVEKEVSVASLEVSEAETALELSESALAKKEESIQSLLESRRLSDAADAEPIRLAAEVSEAFVPATAVEELEGATLEDGKLDLGEGLEVPIAEPVIAEAAIAEPLEAAVDLDGHDIAGDSLESIETRPLEPHADDESESESDKEEPEPEPAPEPVDATMAALQQELETERMKVEGRRAQLSAAQERLSDASKRREELTKQVDQLRIEVDEAKKIAAEADAGAIPLLCPCC